MKHHWISPHHRDGRAPPFLNLPISAPSECCGGCGQPRSSASLWTTFSRGASLPQFHEIRGVIKSISRAIGRILLAFAGGIGGAVVGGLVLLTLLHCRIIFHLELPSVWLMLPVVIPVSVVAGVIAPKFVMMFALSPLAWLSSEGGEAATWPEFLYNASYLLGLALFGFGVFFSIPWLVAPGLVGILLFAVGVFRGLDDGDAPGAQSKGG
jgi:hypothetical protein